jgi:glycosyltransferase involved in cell wall biosynthesis
MVVKMKNNFLFNFSASYSGGGFKRLYEYLKWFNENGGAWFIIHPHCEDLIREFPNNRFFLACQPKYQRIFNDCSYLHGVEAEMGIPDLYYSYGIPIYAKFGRVNWFHLSNVLPLLSRDIPLSLFDRLKLRYLGWRIKDNFQNADIISAESKYSLDLIDTKQTEKLFLSVNGNNDELAHLKNGVTEEKDNIATVIGTYGYKALRDSYHVFEMLRQKNSQLKLIIIGNESAVPKDLRNNQNIIILGVLKKRSKVIDYLRKTRYYISTTYIENSYNAASEGIFFADESFISDIGPHRELLINMPFDKISIPNMRRPVLHVKRKNLSGLNLKTWEDVIADMISKVCSASCS